MADSAHKTASSIAVIGGGIAGLSAAWQAIRANPGRRVVIFEAADQMGGVLQTIEMDGFLVERSADSFLVTEPLPQLYDLVVELGLLDELIETNTEHRQALIVRGDRLIPVPHGFQLMAATDWRALLASPALPWAARLRAAFEPWVRRRVAGPEESVTQFIARRIGKEAFEYLAQPLVAGIYSADPDLLSAPAAIKQYVDFEQKYGSVTRGLLATGSRQSTASGARYGKFRTFRRGMGTLVGALEKQLAAAGVSMLANTRVSALSRAGESWSVATESTGGTATESFEAVVVACSAAAAARLLANVDQELSRALGAIPYTKVAVVSAAVSHDSLANRLSAFGIVVPRREQRPIIAASFSSIKFAGRAPEGHELVRLFLGGALQPEVAELPADELAVIAQSELRRLLQLKSAARVLDVAVWHDASPQYNLKHLGRVETIRSRLDGLRGLALAGSAYEGVGLPQCVRSGRQAASQLE